MGIGNVAAAAMSAAGWVLLCLGLCGASMAAAPSVPLSRTASYADQQAAAEASPSPRKMSSVVPGDRYAVPLITALHQARPMIAVDIDETLCVTDYTSLLWGIGKDDSKPLPDAQSTLQRLAGLYDVIYVTARPRSIAEKTERWLGQHGFPAGRVVTSPTVGDFILQSNYKRNVFRRLRQEYPNLVIGIGDKVKDAEAYRANGMVPVIVNPWEGREYRRDDNVCKNWAAVRAFFEVNRETLSNPKRLSEMLVAGRLHLQQSDS